MRSGRSGTVSLACGAGTEHAELQKRMLEHAELQERHSHGPKTSEHPYLSDISSRYVIQNRPSWRSGCGSTKKLLLLVISLNIRDNGA
jgi:hypothetical protein